MMVVTAGFNTPLVLREKLSKEPEATRSPSVSLWLRGVVLPPHRERKTIWEADCNRRSVRTELPQCSSSQDALYQEHPRGSGFPVHPAERKLLIHLKPKGGSVSVQ